MNLNTIRRMAGVSEVYVGDNAEYTTLTEDKQPSSIDKFWVVVDPTPNSELGDIMWEDSPQKFSKSAVLGGHQSREYFEKYYSNVTFYAKETPAKRDAKERLENRKVAESVVTEAKYSVKELESTLKELEAKQKERVSDARITDQIKNVKQMIANAKSGNDKFNEGKRVLPTQHTKGKTTLMAKGGKVKAVLNKDVKDKEKEGYVLAEMTANEDCGMAHGENEEANPNFAKCPFCQKQIGKPDFYDHAMDEHSEEMQDARTKQNAAGSENEEMGYEDEEMNYEDEEAMNYKTTLNKGQHVEYKGQPHIVVVPDAQGDFVGIAPVGQEDDENAINLVHARELMKDEDEEEIVMDVRVEDKDVTEAAEPATVWDKAMDDKDESPESPKQEDIKVTVPPKVKSALKKEIKELETAAKKIEVSDSARAEFYTNSANAMNQILDYLDFGTMEGIKKAQIHMTSLMSPIVQRIPDIAHDFITGGGKPKTLKSLFNKVKEKK